MIEYVTAGNTDDRVLSRSAALLANGGILALPLDTSWAVACSLRSKEGIKKLRRISGERDERHFTLLCSDISQFGELCNLDNTRFRLIKRLSPGPYVWILKTLLGTEKTLGLRRREVGVRIPDHPLPLDLIAALGCPLYTITAKRSMANDDRDDAAPDTAAEESAELLPPIPEEDLFDGGWEMEGLAGLDLVLDTGEERPRIFSTILDISGDGVRLIRSGAGPWPI
ncbi:L-threonylcarbamoyladenylate synthase [Treponema primitia]|uniref:L-threonylcarbamoyladenylate synthase n=1 Tax=Treponema primitia TaxID=88058 RepID=UPI0002554D70|nr:L-threonylcarbamoyladenylate synthase [Treponema primitia]